MNYIWIDGRILRDSQDKPMRVPKGELYELLESISEEPVRVRNIYNERYGTYDVLYIDKHGKELWTTSNYRSQPVIR